MHTALITGNPVDAKLMSVLNLMLIKLTELRVIKHPCCIFSFFFCQCVFCMDSSFGRRHDASDAGDAEDILALDSRSGAARYGPLCKIPLFFHPMRFI